MTPQALSAAQYSGKAEAYAASVGHAHAGSLADLVDFVGPTGDETMLDVATGGGHLAHAFRPRVAEVVAYDLVPDMLLQAQAKGLRSVRGMAERLPFCDGAFDLVGCRYAAHHFSDVDTFLGESHRVLRRDGKLLIVDITVPEDPVLAAEINRIEKLRDPSHGRNLAPSEWSERLRKAGFGIERQTRGVFGQGLRMEFGDWTRRIGTPKENLAQLREAFHTASPALVEALRIDLADTITFELDEAILLAQRL